MARPRPAATSAAPTALSDSRLLVQAQAGGREARDELARRMRGPAYVLALQLVGNREDALDVAQDALLRLFAHIARVSPDRPLRPWLFAIVRNRARDLWRRRVARPSESLDARPDLSSQLTARSGDPERQAARRQFARRVWSAIGELSRSHREILVLRDFHDLTYAEIAETLDIPLGTVMSRLHAARSALRVRLEADGGRHV
jgi:RNA polymerase sigma-70 factor (ECF subfamily)